VPFFGDQFFWGERAHARGVGPAPIPIAELTVEALSNAIRFMLDPEVVLFLMLSLYASGYM
jgi:sterol 3beta-glucosyltransferase